MADSLFFMVSGILDALSRKIPLIFIDLRGRKCSGIGPVLPAEFGLEKTAETLELSQLGVYAGACGGSAAMPAHPPMWGQQPPQALRRIRLVEAPTGHP